MVLKWFMFNMFVSTNLENELKTIKNLSSDIKNKTGFLYLEDEYTYIILDGETKKLKLRDTEYNYINENTTKRRRKGVFYI